MRMCETNDKQVYLLKYIGLFLVFLVSGSVWGFILNASLFVPLFFLYGIFIGRKAVFRCDADALGFCLIYILWMLYNYLFCGTHGPSDFNEFIVYIFFAIGTLCLFQSYKFNDLSRMYLNIAVFVAVSSIVLFLLHQIGFLPYKFIRKGPSTYMMSLFNVFGWRTPFNRLAGPYWEPGTFQIVLSYALLLYFKKIISFQLEKKEGIKILIIVVAILMTKSTAGYVCLSIMALLLMVNVKITRKTLAKYVLMGMALILGCFFLFSSETYKDKMNQRGYENTSYEIRRMDNLAMLQMTIEKPFLGYGICSNEFRNRGKSLGNSTSSNGLLYMSSHLGVFFLLFYVVALYKRMKYFFPQKTFLLLVYTLLLQAFEVYFYFPLSFIFFFCKKDKESLIIPRGM